MNFRIIQTLFIFIAYPLFLFSQESEDLLPRLSSEQYNRLLRSYSQIFPFVERALGQDGTNKIINNYSAFRDTIMKSNHYNDFLQKTSSPLLTLEVTREVKKKQTQTEEIDRNFITQWRDQLVSIATQGRFIDLNNAEGRASILKEVQDILKKPYLLVAPSAFLGALANPLGNEEVFSAFKQGDLSVLEEHLPENPESIGFRPDAFSLPKDQGKDFYINILREIVDSQERVDHLLVSYILATQAPNHETIRETLSQIDESKIRVIAEKDTRKKSAKEIAGDNQVIEKRLILRIKAIEKQTNKHKTTETAKERKKVLTLVEVHPLLSVFRGYIGGDCATSCSFAYPYSPEEKVFFILNKKGEDVGYLNGTIVNLENGGQSFFRQYNSR